MVSGNFKGAVLNDETVELRQERLWAMVRMKSFSVKSSSCIYRTP